MRTISQRELRNDNAAVIRAVEGGESFIVTKNGSPVAVVRPVGPGDIPRGLPLGRAARRRGRLRDWSRVPAETSTAAILDDVRGDR